MTNSSGQWCGNSQSCRILSDKSSEYWEQKSDENLSKCLAVGSLFPHPWFKVENMSYNVQRLYILLAFTIQWVIRLSRQITPCVCVCTCRCTCMCMCVHVHVHVCMCVVCGVCTCAPWMQLGQEGYVLSPLYDLETFGTCRLVLESPQNDHYRPNIKGKWN